MNNKHFVKITSLLLLIVTVLLSFTACYWGEADLIDEESKSMLIYHGNTYVWETEYHLESLVYKGFSEKDVGIESHIIIAGGRVFSTLYVEKPLFIECSNWSMMYFLEDFDYKAQTYVISGTDIEFKLEDFFEFPYDSIPEDFPSIFYDRYYERIQFRMKGAEYIGKNLELIYYNGRWCGNLYRYGAYGAENKIFAINEEIATLLEERGVLSSEKPIHEEPIVDYSVFEGIESPLYELLTNQAIYNEYYQNHLYDVEFYGTPLFECKDLNFVYTDHDANNIYEVLIRHPIGAIMYVAAVPPNKWNGYKQTFAYSEFGGPSMTDLRDNGVFAWDYNFGKVKGFSQIRNNSDNSINETIELCRIELDDNYENPRYFVNNKEVTKSEYDTFVSNLDGNILEWKKFPSVND